MVGARMTSRRVGKKYVTKGFRTPIEIPRVRLLVSDTS